MKKSIIILVPTALLFFAQPNYTRAQSDLERVAATLILEAGGETDQRAMLAVYEVLRNRAKIRNMSLSQVAFQPKQFSCWNNTSKHQELIAKAKRHPNYNKAVQIVKNQYRTNVTNGATHYHTLKVNPYWSKAYNKVRVIENHIFYR